MPKSSGTSILGGKLESLTQTQNEGIEALIDYIMTTPQNINYNIVREIINAIVLDEFHPYFDYYYKKITPPEDQHKPFVPIIA